MRRKLFSIWWLVLLRGIVESALVTPFFLPVFDERDPLELLVAAVALLGGLLELAMFAWMRGHIFQGILRVIGIAGVLFGGYVLLDFPINMQLLLVLTGMWLAVRGLAVLWLGLSIIQRPLDRAIPAAAGVFSLIFGAISMLWLPAQVDVFSLFISAYGVGSALVHIAVALRMRAVGSLGARVS